jgi:hypothetical protein
MSRVRDALYTIINNLRYNVVVLGGALNNKGELASNVIAEVTGIASGSVIIEHIPAGTTPTGSLEAVVPIYRLGYSRGVIWINIQDVTPAGDLAGDFEIAYSADGNTFSEWQTLATVANIGVDDSQDLFVEFSQYSVNADAAGFPHIVIPLPYFKIRDAMTGTLAAVTFGVTIIMER